MGRAAIVSRLGQKYTLIKLLSQASLSKTGLLSNTACDLNQYLVLILKQIKRRLGLFYSWQETGKTEAAQLEKQYCSQVGFAGLDVAHCSFFT